MRAAFTSFRVVVTSALLALLMSAGARSAPRELRVCAEPDNLPFSNQKLEGFENKLATLIAADLQFASTSNPQVARSGLELCDEDIAAFLGRIYTFGS